MAVLLAVLGFCFVIVVHELGHFLFAKWAGVRVDAFSVGFGPVLWAKKVGETEYRISLIWAGGYVAMPGEQPGVEGADDPRSFARAKPGWRALILLGGVLFNLVSSWILLVVLALVGMPLAKPIVGGLEPRVLAPDETTYIPSPAVALGLQVGDEIRSVNGVRTRSIDDVLTQVAGAGVDPIRVTVRRDGQDLDLDGGGSVTAAKIAGIPIPVLGFVPATSRRIDGVVGVRGAGDTPLKSGWTIQAIDGVDVGDKVGQELDLMLARRLGEQVTIAAVTDTGDRHQVTLRYAGDTVLTSQALGLSVRIRARPFPGSAADRAGLQAGDVITAINGQRISGGQELAAAMQRSPDGKVTLTRWRDGETAEVALEGEVGPDGKVRVGIPIGDVTHGWLGDAPPTGRGLGAEGLKVTAETCLFGIDQAEADRAEGVVQVTLIDGGERIIVPLAAADVAAFKDSAGWRVQAIGDTDLTLRGPGKKARTITVAGIPGLKEGDGIVRAGDHGTGHALVVVRGGSERTVGVRLPDIGYAFSFTAKDKQVYDLEEGFGEAIAIANRATVDTVVLTLKIIPRLFRPSAPDGLEATKTLSGPLGIFNMLRISFDRWGVAAWLHLVCLIGLNLFLINLLPIPVVDGGQLVILGIETLIRRPLPMGLRNAIFMAGFALVVALMLFVIGIDINRFING